MNKSTVTNLISAVVAIAGYFSPSYGDIILMTGLFALSGGVTNWLAVHMLFERVPLLYGSGVIPSRFEEFRAGIRQLVVQEFFNRENIEKFLADADTGSALAAEIDSDGVFEKLVDVIEQSSLGNMLTMVGGRAALEPLREPVAVKMREMISEIAGQGAGNAHTHLTDTLLAQVEAIIDKRLAELTPEHVKGIVEDMIRKHLGWLVVWGGVFGGLIGLVVSVWQSLG
ncbi:MAG: DUF445 family protein [Chromatiales bacterium]|nr:DUF445 family protein [Chromatiales bacterium]